MGDPNPFMFGGGGGQGGGDMANPFMGGQPQMPEMNPYMAQQQMMGGMGMGYPPYGQMGQANPFGMGGMGMGYPQAPGMGYQQPQSMGYYGGQQQEPNSFYDQYGQAAEQPTSLPVGGVSAGASLFGVEEPTAALSVTSGSPTSDANPFLQAAQTESNTFQPIEAPEEEVNAANPFAMAEPEIIKPAPIKEPVVEASVKLPEIPVRPDTLVSNVVGGLETSTTDMLEKLEIAKTPVVPGVQEEAKSESSSDTESEPELEALATTAKESQEPPNLIDVEQSAPEIKIEESAPIERKDSKESGFGGIFVNQEQDEISKERIQTATSHVSLNENESKDSDAEESKPQKEKSEPSDSSDESESAAAPPKETFNTGGTAAGLFDDAPSDIAAKPTTISTGDAIFSDLPSMPDIKSTGAAIFGMSDESAAGSTGAALFDIVAPEASRPCHGEMTGWDENFDKKFAKAELVAATASTDAFGMSQHAAGAFGAPVMMPPSQDPNFGDSFGMLPVQADMNNPFLAEQKEKKDGDENDSDEFPLFDTDVSKPLEVFPRVDKFPDGWDMYIRHPPKKKVTSQRYWKKVHVKIANQDDNPTILLFDSKENKDPFQEIPLQAAYSLSDISHQVFDQYSKVFTIKLQYIFYKERAGIRPGQVTKMQKLTDKFGFLAKAVEDADLKGVKEFASDMKKLGVPLEHAPQISELLKLASYSYEDMKQFSVCIEEKLFKLDVHRDKALTYKTEEVQLTAVDEVYVEQTADGHITKHLCRVRVFFLSFLSGMPVVELGVNDMTRMGLEVVGRHDILPVPTEQWIRYEAIEFHSVVDKKEFDEADHIIKFQPPDACYIEVMRFRTRPPRSRELPMQARCTFIINGNKIEIRADIMVPYHATKAWGQVPCDDVAMMIPLPECWIYQFRTEKQHLSLAQVRDALSSGNINLATRMGSVKSAHRRAGKVKGIDRFLGTMETASQDLMETSSGVAKYEHQHKSIVWRVPRLPKHGQGSYTNHEFVCRLNLTSYDQMPESFEKHFTLEFTQPATCESYTVLRSVSIQDGSGEPPEKFVKYLARHEYKIGIDFQEGKEKDAYRAATAKPPTPPPVQEQQDEMREYEDFPDENGRKDSDSDSD